MSQFIHSFVTLIVAVLLFVPSSAYAAPADDASHFMSDSLSRAHRKSLSETEADQLKREKVELPNKLDADLSRLIRSWNRGYVSRQKGQPCQDDATAANHPKTSDSIYIERLSKLPAAISMTFNPVVKECIELYVERRRPLLRSMLTLGDLYFPMIEEALDRHKLPDELKYLAIVESALNPTAVSSAGASGLWQFMLSTGKVYGLEVNSLVDDRFDPQKSTDAACRYLKDLYGIYDDWLLAIAAYNCGPGNVNRALRAAGGDKADFWKIYLNLPRETRSYIPLFMAAYYSMTYHREHNICPRDMIIPLATDTMMLDCAVSLDRIAELSGVEKDVICLLNPQYKRNVIPGNIKPYSLRMPVASLNVLSEKRDSLVSPELAMKLVSPNTASNSKEVASGSSKYHVIRKGDTLSSIAKRYNTTVAALQRMNGKRVSSAKNLRIGARIKVRR